VNIAVLIALYFMHKSTDNSKSASFRGYKVLIRLEFKKDLETISFIRLIMSRYPHSFRRSG
jgi:hypothetical protein